MVLQKYTFFTIYHALKFQAFMEANSRFHLKQLQQQWFPTSQATLCYFKFSPQYPWLLLLLLWYVCVFILFHLLVSSGCTTSETYVRRSDQRSFVVSISWCCCQVPSSLSLNLSYFTSKDENSSQPLTGEKTI